MSFEDEPHAMDADATAELEAAAEVDDDGLGDASGDYYNKPKKYSSGSYGHSTYDSKGTYGSKKTYGY